MTCMDQFEDNVKISFSFLNLMINVEQAIISHLAKSSDVMHFCATHFMHSEIIYDALYLHCV